MKRSTRQGDGGGKAASKPTAPTRVGPNPADDLANDPWFVEEVTSAESADETAERLRRAEEEAAAFEVTGPSGRAARKADEPKRHRTVESDVSSLIASRDARPTPLVLPTVNDTEEIETLEEVDDDEGSGRVIVTALRASDKADDAVVAPVEDGAPDAPASDVVTRQIGVDRSPPSGLHRSEFNRRPKTDPQNDPAAEFRRRAGQLVDRCRAAFERRQTLEAARFAEDVLQLGESAPPPGIAEVIEPARPLLERVFSGHVGPAEAVPQAALGPDEIARRSLDHRLGFLLSRVDGATSVEALLEISGMGRFETLRLLSWLLRDGLIKFA